MGLFQNEQTFYTIRYEEDEGSMRQKNNVLQMTLEFDTQTKYHSRQIYGILDMLGDVGGLSDALLGIGSFLVIAI